jgi:hypothetical protein
LLPARRPVITGPDRRSSPGWSGRPGPPR